MGTRTCRALEALPMGSVHCTPLVMHIGKPICVAHCLIGICWSRGFAPKDQRQMGAEIFFGIYGAYWFPNFPFELQS